MKALAQTKSGTAQLRLWGTAWSAYYPRYRFFGVRLRLAAVGLLWVAGYIGHGTAFGRQLEWGLHYFAAILIALAIAYAAVLVAVNAVPALLWCLFPFRLTRTPGLLGAVYRPFYDLLTAVNRNLGHGEAYLVWTIVILAWWSDLHWQLFLLGALHFFAEPFLDLLAVARIRWRRAEHLAQSGSAGPSACDDYESLRARGLVHWERRPIIYAFTLAGLLALALLSPAGIAEISVLLVGIGGAVVLRMAKRYLRAWERSKEASGLPSDLLTYCARRLLRRPAPRPARGGTPEAEPPSGIDMQRARDEFRERHIRWYAWLDTPLVLAAGILIGFLYLAVREKRDAQAEDLYAASPPRSAGAALCTTGAPVIPKPEISLFVLADSQIHELDGHRFDGQMAFANALVPVARRPVELDILTGAVLMRLATIYRQLAAANPARDKAGTLPWLYLGDFADLSCKSELERVTDLLLFFPLTRHLGTAPGNHDGNFTGNFAWSPYWDRACRRRHSPAGAADGPLSKRIADRMLHDHFSSAVAQNGGRMTALTAPASLGGYARAVVTGFRRGSALVTVTPLGEVADADGRRRGVLGVFLDTADRMSGDFVLPGLAGSFSRHQADRLWALVKDRKRASGPAYDDPFFVLFAHHPLDSLNGSSADHLAQFAKKLEPKKDERILGVVTGHTHRSQERSLCLHDRRVDELILGSTTDLPQEAGVLHIGRDDRGVLSMSLATIPAISTAAPGCEEPGAVHSTPALHCQRIMAALSSHPRCEPLFHRDDDTPGSDCRALEQPTTLAERLVALFSYRGPDDLDELEGIERAHAASLLECLCRDGGCRAPSPADVFNHESFWPQLAARIERDPAAEAELACFAWAAATVQEHKARGMEFADALRCAFDSPWVPAPQEMTTSLERRACRF